MANTDQKTSRKGLIASLKASLLILFKQLHSLAVQSLFWLVRAYQLIISPIVGPRCRYFPSCSHYCQEALVEHGLLKGLWLSLKRISRCHPGYAGGYDPVPKKSCHPHG